MIVPDQEYLDFSHVPHSRGIPKSLVIAGLIGIAMIFVIGGFCVVFAGYGHKWPSTATMRVNMGPLHL